MGQYLVRGEYVDPGPLLPPEQAAELIETRVLPTFDAIANLQKQGKVLAGGLFAADRAAVLVVEAADNDEVGRLIHGLPGWGIISCDVRPLESFASRAALDRETVEQLRA
jgi:Muconolactone delta-isomerase